MIDVESQCHHREALCQNKGVRLLLVGLAPILIFVSNKKFCIRFSMKMLTCFSDFSSIVYLLQLSLMSGNVPLSGTEVAVVRGSQEHKYALKKQAIPVVFDNTSQLLQSIQEKQVTKMQTFEFL